MVNGVNNNAACIVHSYVQAMHTLVPRKIDTAHLHVFIILLLLAILVSSDLSYFQFGSHQKWSYLVSYFLACVHNLLSN
jgi:hypothetical protein